MSGHELPEDLKDWPRDPYRLLGVRYGVAPRDLKRAYLHLIRQFKPEHHPDHFRRIRDAYETLLSHGGGRNPSAPPIRDDEDEAETTAPVDPEVPGRPRGEECRPRVATPDDLWELACLGQGPEAYRELRVLRERTPHDEELYVLLYWLLLVWPELDPGRSARDWLADGLRSAPYSHRLRELYRREIEADPNEALTSRVAGLIRLEGAAGLVLDVAAWRWRAAQRLERGEVIVDDMKLLRKAGTPADEPTWIRLLVSSAAHLAWSDNFLRDGVGYFCAEIERLDHLHAGLDDELLQLDYTLAISEGWLAMKRERGTPESLSKLLPRSWNWQGPGLEAWLEPFLESVATNPREALDLFDRIRQKAPAVIGHLAELMETYRANSPLPPDPRSANDLAGPILTLLGASEWWDYSRFRLPLLSFCLREAIAPGIVAELARVEPTLAASNPPLAESIDNDWPLRHVFDACELFWN